MHNSQKCHMRFGNLAENTEQKARFIDLKPRKCYNISNYKLMKNFSERNEDDMTICRKCGTSNKDNQKFCSFCHELLIADPVELEKLEQARQKQQKKLDKKLEAKYKRWKRAPLLLIPIGILALIGLVLVVDALLFGLPAKILMELLVDFLDPDVTYLIALIAEIVFALATFAMAFGVLILMIVRIVKWAKHKKGDKATSSAVQAKDTAQQQSAANATVSEDMVATMSQREVSYAVLMQAAGKKADYLMPAPAKEISVKELYTALTGVLWEYDHASVRRVLSAMSASRMLICSAGAIDGAGIFDALCAAFCVKAEAVVCEQPDAVFADVVLHANQQGTTEHSAFAKALYTARFSPDNVCLAGVRGVGSASVQSAFGAMTEYFKLPGDGAALYMGKPAAGTQIPEGIAGGKMLLPGNLWIMNVLSDEELGPCVDSKIGEYCAAIYLRNSQYVFPPEKTENDHLALPSVSALENAIAAAEQEYCLPEELWKVLDALEEQMQALCGNRFSNRTLRALERYSSVYMACGGKQYEAFDNGLAAIVLPGYSRQIRALEDREEGETLSALLERTMGRDRLPMTMEVLASMKL